MLSRLLDTPLALLLVLELLALARQSGVRDQVWTSLCPELTVSNQPPRQEKWNGG